jgi:ribosome-associated toxin RatA of RatAB toxin-antitoxin module
MHAENAILIGADIGRVYALAAAVERWPQLLPHYRWVRVLQDGGDCRLVEMAARRDAIPVWWCAEQRLSPDVPRITFRHVRGITSGMEVEWSFEPTAGGVLVTIRHDLALRMPMLGRPLANWVIGPLFVRHIAAKTLGRIKEVAEAAA